MKNNKGVSLITLIITIVVIIILAAISMQTSSDIPDQANYTKYMQEMKNVQTGVENAKLTNAKKGTSVEKLTSGFKKVYLENAPASFVSFGDIYDEVTGYLVNLSDIGYTQAEYGQGYRTYFENENTPTIKFGDNTSDVFVIDAEWTVYYVKGLRYKDSMNYTFK